ncbi:hypothetical protein R6Q57_003370 [Mikania cordata]
MQTRKTFSWIKEQITRSISVSLMIYIITRTFISNAYPIFAQQSYENPRETTGRIVCANCHLANKPVDIEVPQAIYSEITFPILSPDPATKKDIHLLKYPIYVGGNRGRGQIYPDGRKSNNTVYNAAASGIVSKILRKEKRGYKITIADASDGRQVVDINPSGPELLVSEGESIKLDQPLTSNPNVGGFDQGDAEIVLQDPLHVEGLLFFFASVYEHHSKND